MVGHTASAAPVVLVVDDEATSRLLVREALEVSGFTVEEAESGEQALEILPAMKPDLIILDVLMPGMDGFATCAALRRLDGDNMPPILFMTGLENEASIAHAYEVGATDFVTKPFSALLLSQRVQAVLRANRTLRGLREREALMAKAQRLADLGGWVLDLASDAMRLTPEADRILGGRTESRDLAREAFLDLVPDEDRPSVQRALDALAMKGTPLDITHRVRRADGSERVVTQRAERECDPSGKPLRLIGSLQDITPLRRN